MATITKKRSRFTGTMGIIVELCRELTPMRQKELEKQLRMMLLMEEAQRLSAGVKKNDITMEDIIKEVRKHRNENN